MGLGYKMMMIGPNLSVDLNLVPYCLMTFMTLLVLDPFWVCIWALHSAQTTPICINPEDSSLPKWSGAIVLTWLSRVWILDMPPLFACTSFLPTCVGFLPECGGYFPTWVGCLPVYASFLPKCVGFLPERAGYFPTWLGYLPTCASSLLGPSPFGWSTDSFFINPDWFFFYKSRLACKIFRGSPIDISCFNIPPQPKNAPAIRVWLINAAYFIFCDTPA